VDGSRASRGEGCLAGVGAAPELAMADELKRAVVWKNLLLDGTDHCALFRTTEGWLLKGTVVGVLKDHRPMLANYEIYCDENWLTHRVQVERRIGSDVKDLASLWKAVGCGAVRVRSCELSVAATTLIWR
jgi:Putative glycolipid-binding